MCKYNQEEAAAAVSESDSEEELKEVQWTAVRPKNKCSLESVSALLTTENKSNCQLSSKTSEEVG